MEWALFGAEELFGKRARNLISTIEETGLPLPSCFPHVHSMLLESQTAEKRVLATMLAKLRVKTLTVPLLESKPLEPLPAEVAFEERFLTNPKKKPHGIPYEGVLLQASLRPLLKKAGFSCLSASFPVIVLNDLLATFEPSDRRYHLRTNILGFPALISIPGVVLAPAKPREYYLLKRSGIDPDSLDHAFKGLFIGHDDPRMPRVVAGFALQALAYAQTGKPFCKDARCCLYNTHWQQELIALYGADEALDALEAKRVPLCPDHSTMIKGWRVAS